MKSRLLSGLTILALVLGAAHCALAQATNLTAFALAKQGNQLIAPAAKEGVTQIHSEKSDSSLVPNIWYVEYMDPSVAFKVTEVKFVNGKVVDVKHPKRVKDIFTGSRLLEWKKLKIDSDRALAIARKQPMLKGAELESVQMWLERTPQGASWRVHFWACKPGRADLSEDLGEILISSRNGAILDNKLRDGSE